MTALQPTTRDFSRVPIQRDWSFAGKTIADTTYITHGYYTYPAKFIPQLAARLINDYSAEGDTVVDPFMGSGTTVVEALVNNRIGIGTDINEIAVLLAKVKTTPVTRSVLVDAFAEIMDKASPDLNGATLLNGCRAHNKQLGAQEIRLPDRVDYWFKPHIKSVLLALLQAIREIRATDARDFFLVAFAQILKSCSIWTQKSVKPTRDFAKQEIDPLAKFKWQANKMIARHADFNALLNAETKARIAKRRIIRNADSRSLPCADGGADLMVTSPPYVTSYEYADLHQLASLWFGYLDDLQTFRKKFIGSGARVRKPVELQSVLADDIVSQLGDSKKAFEVRNYFADMLETFVEMRRALKVGGKAAVVIGNTKLRGVNIRNAEVFHEQFENIGFTTHDVIHREIPSKMLPSTRDSNTGRFVKSANAKFLAYPTEFILVVEKAGA